MKEKPLVQKGVKMTQGKEAARENHQRPPEGEGGSQLIIGEFFSSFIYTGIIGRNDETRRDVIKWWIRKREGERPGRKKENEANHRFDEHDLPWQMRYSPFRALESRFTLRRHIRIHKLWTIQVGSRKEKINTRQAEGARKEKKARREEKIKGSRKTKEKVQIPPFIQTQTFKTYDQRETEEYTPFTPQPS